jgi:hypothetical protein
LPPAARPFEIVRLLIPTVPPAMKNARSVLCMSIVYPLPTMFTLAFTIHWLEPEMLAASQIVLTMPGLAVLLVKALATAAVRSPAVETLHVVCASAGLAFPIAAAATIAASQTVHCRIVMMPALAAM